MNTPQKLGPQGYPATAVKYVRRLVGVEGKDCPLLRGSTSTLQVHDNLYRWGTARVRNLIESSRVT